MHPSDVIARLKETKFTKDSALVTIDFLIRHGVVTIDNEPEYMQVGSQLKRILPFEMIKFDMK
jgi:hypothetical protein